MQARWLSLVAIGAVAACGRDRQEAAATDQATDTAAVADATTGAPGTARGGTRGGVSTAANAAESAVVIQVQEEVPGLLEQARYHPLDAQHIAQGKYPTGKIQAGFLERRGKDLVYRFRIQAEDNKVWDVLVNSYDGKLINSIAVK